MTPPTTVPAPLADAVCQRWPERGPQWVDVVEHELRDLCARYAARPEQVLPARYGFVVAVTGACGRLVLRASADPNGHSQAKVAAKLGEIAVGPRVHEIINTGTGTWTVMERVEPGDSFSEAPPSDSAIDSLVHTLASMADATEPDELPPLTDWLRDRLLDDDLQELPPGRTPAPRVERHDALAVLAELSDHRSPGLGHGDLSPGNVLRHHDGQFLVIDPRGFDGDVAYDVAVLALKTPQYGTPDDVASTLARRLGLDTDRIRAWQSIAAARVQSSSSRARSGQEEPSVNGPERILFVGITTAGSAVRKVFPAWMDLLGENIQLDTLDIPAGSLAGPYRELVTSIKSDPTIRGAVITAHKSALYDHATDLLDGVDETAEQLGEVSVIYRTGEGIRGTVIEHLSITQALTDMGNGTPITRHDADVVVFGAGGTAVAFIAALKDGSWPDTAQPRILHLVDVSQDRLEHARKVAEGAPRPLRVHLHRSAGTIHLSDLPDLPTGSLIINATGLGKDQPGTPLELPAPWPQQAHVWDLNYRGTLVVLSDAERVRDDMRLHIHDGWSLFVHGWAESLARIVDHELDAESRGRLDRLARAQRS